MVKIAYLYSTSAQSLAAKVPPGQSSSATTSSTQSSMRLLGQEQIIIRVQEAFQGVLCNLRHLPKSAMFKPMNEQFRKQLEIHLEASMRRFREFGAIAGTYQNPLCSKPWTIAQAFYSVKIGQFRTLPTAYEIQARRIAQAVRNPFASM